MPLLSARTPPAGGGVVLCASEPLTMPTVQRKSPSSRLKGSCNGSPLAESTFWRQTKDRTSRKTESMRDANHSWSTEMSVSSKDGE